MPYYAAPEHARVVLALRGLAQAMQVCVPWPTDKLNHTYHLYYVNILVYILLGPSCLVRETLWVLGCPLLINEGPSSKDECSERETATIIFAKDVPFCCTGTLTTLTEYRCLILQFL